MHARSLMAAGLLLLASCGSPLDISTPRIDTWVRPPARLRDVFVTARIVGANDSVSINEWPYDVAASRLTIDTVPNPPLVSFDHHMTSRTADTSHAIWLRELHVRIDDARANASLALNGDPASGNGAYARVVIDGVEYEISGIYNANASLHYQIHGRRVVEGTVVIWAYNLPAFSMVISVKFTVSQD